MKRTEIVLLFAINIIVSAQAVQKCFPHYGCYTLDPPWWTISRPFAVLPTAPEMINTRFLLFTRHESMETELVINKTGILDLSEFDSDKNTKFIVHGFLHSVNEAWASKMKNEILRFEDANVVFVEWGDGAGLPYMQAVANARVVGDQLAHLIRFLKKEANMDLKRAHIIGQGIGAHVAGYAGKKIKIGRITALDPVGPYFSGSDLRVRLDKSDADFVDVIHTDGSSLLFLGFGMNKPIGHVDFYPNNGRDQPGCGDLMDRIKGSFWDLVRLNTIGARESVACSHRRAIDIFTESINSKCTFLSFPCKDEAEFKSGACQRCDHGRCSRVGYNSDQFSGRGNMYLSTFSGSPFCHFTYVTSITISQNQRATTGEIYVQVLGKAGRTDLERLNNESEKIRARETYSTALQSVVDMSELIAIRIKFKDTAFLFHQDLIIEKIIISRLDEKLNTIKTFFCVKNTIVSNGDTINVKPTLNSC